jgi:hypothetical protein
MRRVFILSTIALLLFSFAIISVGYAQSVGQTITPTITQQATSATSSNNMGIVDLLNTNSGFVNSILKMYKHVI